MHKPLNNNVLTSPETRTNAAALVRPMTDELPDNVSMYALLIATASTFVGLCDDHDIDAEAAFAQIADILSREDSAMTPKRTETADVALSLN